MQEIGHYLQVMKKLVEVQKECFRVKMKELQEQLYKIEVKLLRLEKELSIFKAKKEKLGEQWGKSTSEIKKNQVPPVRHEKNRENLVEFSEKKKCQTL